MNPQDVLSTVFGSGNAGAWIAAAGAFAVVMLVWRALLEHDPLPARLKALEQRRMELRGAMAVRARRARRLEVKDNVWDRLRRRLRNVSDNRAAVQLKLAQAGFRSQDAVVLYRLGRLVLPAAFAVTIGLLVYVLDLWKLGAMKPMAVLGAALLGLMAPDIYVKNRMEKRREAIRKSMADVFDLLVICAEAGLSMDAALDRVARETAHSAPELSDEIALTGLELSFLPDRHRALSGLAERVPLPGIRAMVNTFIQTERYGTPLAQALRVLATEMREDRMMKAEEKAARLPAILTVPMIVFVLPPLFIVLLGPAIIRTMDVMAGAK